MTGKYPPIKEPEDFDWSLLSHRYLTIKYGKMNFWMMSTVKGELTRQYSEEYLRGTNNFPIEKIFKFVDGKWVKIFERDSHAAFEWFHGNLTNEDLYSMIDW